jgi:hypothetical protein
MTETIQLPDQDDVLATNERLTAENQRLTAELTAATELLETAQTQLNAANAQAAKVTDLEAGITRLKSENATLTAQQADFQKAVAAEVQKLGLRPKAAEHREAPADPDLTPTQRVLAAKGVSSLADLRP